MIYSHVFSWIGCVYFTSTAPYHIIGPWISYKFHMIFPLFPTFSHFFPPKNTCSLTLGSTINFHARASFEAVAPYLHPSLIRNVLRLLGDPLLAPGWMSFVHFSWRIWRILRYFQDVCHFCLSTFFEDFEMFPTSMFHRNQVRMIHEIPRQSVPRRSSWSRCFHHQAKPRGGNPRGPTEGQPRVYMVRLVRNYGMIWPSKADIISY